MFRLIMASSCLFHVFVTINAWLQDYPRCNLTTGNLSGASGVFLHMSELTSFLSTSDLLHLLCTDTNILIIIIGIKNDVFS